MAGPHLSTGPRPILIRSSSAIYSCLMHFFGPVVLWAAGLELRLLLSMLSFNISPLALPGLTHVSAAQDILEPPLAPR